MNKYNLLPGTHVEKACKELKELADKSREEFYMIFNDIKISIKPSSSQTAEQLVEQFHTNLDIKQKEWENSKDGKAYKKEQEIKKQKLEELEKILMEELISKHKNMTGLQLIEWLCKAEEANLKDPEKVINILKEKGYYPDANIKQNYDNSSIENRIGYLVGQCMATLKEGYIHQIIIDLHIQLKKDIKNKVCT